MNKYGQKNRELEKIGLRDIIYELVTSTYLPRTERFTEKLRTADDDKDDQVFEREIKIIYGTQNITGGIELLISVGTLLYSALSQDVSLSPAGLGITGIACIDGISRLLFLEGAIGFVRELPEDKRGMAKYLYELGQDIMDDVVGRICRR